MISLLKTIGCILAGITAFCLFITIIFGVMVIPVIYVAVKYDIVASYFVLGIELVIQYIIVVSLWDRDNKEGIG